MEGKRREFSMRKSPKDMFNLKTMASLESIDFKNMLDYTTQIAEQELSREMGPNLGEVKQIHLKKLR